jgi:two-component system chemotaxis sensor kinase CheA
LLAEGLPQELVARFRSVAQQRLGRIEVCWSDLTSGGDDPSLAAELRRELHTLKGESRAIGFPDINLVCHKLEEMVGRAERSRFRVSDNFDLMVVGAIQFVAMLLRKKPGQAFGGIDLPGFIQQIDEALKESMRPEGAALERAVTSRVRVPEEQASRLRADTLQSLAQAATRVYLEHLGASGAARERLHAIWRDLAAELRPLGAIPLGPHLARHVRGAVELAQDLSRSVELHVDAAGVRLSPFALEAVDAAIVHALRNAVDHGIEPAHHRRQRGKPEVGRIRLSARSVPGGVEIEIEDDGRGVDLDAVRLRAVELGMLSVEQASVASTDELHQLLFAPGFTTSTAVSDVSGRGIGLDAIQSALERIGGRVRFESRPGRGSTLGISMPEVGWRCNVGVARVPGDVLVALPDEWALEVQESAVPTGIDLLALLGIDAAHRQAARFVIGTRRAHIKLHILALERPWRVVVERACPTHVGEPVEVVTFDGQEALLIRPEVVYRIARAAPGGSRAS